MGTSGSARIRTPLDGAWVAGMHREAHRFTGKAGGKDNCIDAMTQLYDYAEHVHSFIIGAESGGDSTLSGGGF